MTRLPAVILFAALALSPAARAAAEPDLTAADNRWNSLRLVSDVAGLGALLAPEFILTHSDGRVQFKADYLNDLSSRSRSNQGIGNEGVEIRRHGDTAVITGTSVQSGTRDGVPWSGRFRFTRVWQLQGARWVLLASHSSRIAEAP